MVKGFLVAGLGLLAVCFPVAAQQPNILRQTINLPLLTLSDAHGLPVSTELGRMGSEPVDLSSGESVTMAEIVVRAHDGNDSPAEGKDSSAAVVSSPSHPISYGGEVGFLYGHASGKYGGDDFQTFVTGTAGNDKFQITVGASREEFNGRGSRWSR